MGFLDEIIDSEQSYRHVQQGTEEWEQIRAGRFTSSEFWKLMEYGTRDMTKEELALRPKTGAGSKTTKIADLSVISQKGISYIHQKVSEVITGKPKPSVYAYPLVYGNETEPLAADFFAEKFGVELEQVGFQTFGEHAGGSPDRIFDYNGEKHGLEIKCPYQSENQISYLMQTDFFDIKRNYPNHYWQCVSLMLFMDIKKWHLVTFDPRIIDDDLKMSYVFFDGNSETIKEDQNRIVSVLENAIKLKLSILNSLTKNKIKSIEL